MSNRIEINKRDDVDLLITITDKDGIAIDLTDVPVFFTVKSSPTDSDDDAIIKKDITSHTFPLLGKTRISLTRAETDLIPQYYFYDVQIKKADKVSSSGMAQMKVVQDITVRIDEEMSWHWMWIA